MDEGDRIVKLISEKLQNGQDWRAALAETDAEAITSRKVQLASGRAGGREGASLDAPNGSGGAHPQGQTMTLANLNSTLHQPNTHGSVLVQAGMEHLQR